MSAAGTAPESVLSTVGCPEMKPRFNEQKATQAAARFLKLANGKMNYLKLIKLLYLLDRESLNRRGRPVTGDQYYSMKLGPVLSEASSSASAAIHRRRRSLVRRRFKSLFTFAPVSEVCMDDRNIP
jgi:uncharacterized phage-associated protein